MSAASLRSKPNLADEGRPEEAPSSEERDSFADDPSLANDPVWQAAMNAPMGGPLSPEELRRIEEAERGPFVPDEVVSAAIAARWPGK